MKLAVTILIISFYTVIAKRKDVGKTIFEHIQKSCTPQEGSKGQIPYDNQLKVIKKHTQHIKGQFQKKESVESLKYAMEMFTSRAKEFLNETRGSKGRLDKPKINNTTINLPCQHDLSAENNTRLHILIQLTIYLHALENKKLVKREINVKSFNRTVEDLSKVVCHFKQLNNFSGLEHTIKGMVATRKKEIGAIFSAEWKAYHLINTTYNFVSTLLFGDDFSKNCLPGGNKIKNLKDKGEKKNNNHKDKSEKKSKNRKDKSEKKSKNHKGKSGKKTKKGKSKKQNRTQQTNASI